MTSYRRHQDLEDLEAGVNPFDIPSTKHASINRLGRWRQAALVLNASRRFRYTFDLKKNEKKQQTLRKIRARAQARQAAQEARQQLIVPNGEFSIGQEQLSSMTRDHNITDLQELGGVKGLSDILKTKLDKGISGDDADLQNRRIEFGSNTYPQKKGRSFWRFLWEAWQDPTLIILTVAAVASLALGIKTQGIKEGWYDGGSIAISVILVIVVTAISDYRQSLQFQKLNDEKRNIHLEVIRGGGRVEVSIYDLVVGDVVSLNIGDQVPADGVVICGHSLSIDESIMTGESKIVHKDSNNPFLMSGCKVTNGSGTMLVTGVGLNTEWGLFMASISEDTGEETPMQVRLNGVATFISIVGLAVAFIVLVVLLARFFTGHTKNPDGSGPFTPGKTKVGDAVDGAIKILTVVVTLVVVAVPEGLPLSVTLILAYSMRKMMADKALVRRLSACETMGSATTICCDKTGTLTLNQTFCQPSVKDAVQKCQIAGVKVRMVTGDNIQTARAIALECGILTADASESNIIEGEEFRNLQDPGREEIAEKISVMGGSSANDKLLLVQALRNRGHVVAVTVDNDAPALHEADIHLAMGIQGTKVAKESSDIIILDGSFASVEKVVRWGRSVYANMQKFIQFQLTVIVVALVINFVAAVSSGDVPLNVVQLLWVKLIMDTLGALALATERLTDHQMQRPPVVRREPLITNITWGDRFIQVIYHLSVLIVLNSTVVALVIYFVAKVSSGDFPTITGKLLGVTLFIEFLGSLTMAIEPPTDHQMQRPPVVRREPLITNIMWRNLLIQAIYQSSVLLALNFYGKSVLNLKHDTRDHVNKVKNTLIFNSFVICQIFNEFNARKPDERNIFAGITKNRLFMGIVALTVVLQILIIEFLGKFTSTVRLNWKQWIISVVIGFIGWPLAFIGKFIRLPATPLSSCLAD